MQTLPPHQRALVVSLHDVSPLTLPASRAILAELRELGVAHTSLLVVPDHHGRGHFLNDREFCDWLLAQHEAGHEIVIHGYYHRRERKAGETPLQKFITRSYTSDEGEFYDIGGEQALQLVAKAQREFASLGLHPPGFIAPAWLLSDAGEQALREAGVRYTTRIGSVLSLFNGVKHKSQSMVYSPRTALRRGVSLAWNASLFRRLRRNPLLRVGIHPPDIGHAKIWRQIKRCIALGLEDRAPMTYWEWITASGAVPAPHHVQG